MTNAEYDHVVEIIQRFTLLGELPSPDEFSAAAAQLDSRFAIVVTTATEVDLGQIIAAAGLETNTIVVYQNDGSITELDGISGTGSVLDHPSPFEAAVEIGIAVLGDEGIDSLNGFSITSEVAVGIGVGITAPTNQLGLR